ncbi:hypothetical protein AA0112_g12390 [Alternaria arborescens]|nr:hypothetical protein AA0112_g12390 [Alternaria arborescens]
MQQSGDNIDSSQDAAGTSAIAQSSSSASKPIDDGFAPSQLPTPNLPKGGGAVRGIGEKFSVNSATGTGSTSVPIQISPSRSGFNPQLSLSYDSGSGNGPFGFGWQVNVPSISRKTDKVLPQYRDDEESDVYLLAGSEDLVPLLVLKDGNWVRKPDEKRIETGVTYTIRQYRPRIEGAFSRIEQWSQSCTGDIHWRVITGDNTTTIYGESRASKIYDPLQGPLRCFSWLLSRGFDDKGNVYTYEYKAEDSEGVDTLAPQEHNRTELSRSSQRYMKRIKYGNRVSRVVDSSCEDRDWMFEVVFDYGEHPVEGTAVEEVFKWDVRPDPFSSYRAGFELRTYRLCKRVLMFHHFEHEPDIGKNCLVSTFEISSRKASQKSFNRGNRVASFISSVTQRAYQWKDGAYISKALPPLEFEYSEPEISEEIQFLDPSALENLPAGDDLYRWIDLDGEGIPGVLTRQGMAYHYKHNWGGGHLGPVQTLPSQPAGVYSRTQDRWMDLSGDGRLSWVDFDSETPGFYPRVSEEDEFAAFRPFEKFPSDLLKSDAVQFIDLSGDGIGDILMAKDETFTWYPSLGDKGYGEAQHFFAPQDDERGPRLLLSDSSEAVYIADMSGDGLADILRIRSGQICYWPNLGHGKFGKKVLMANSPYFDDIDSFTQTRLRLFDIDGSGTTDLIYLGEDGLVYFQNESGNSWSEGRCIKSFPKFHSLAQVQVADILGQGTGCLIWSSSLPGDFGRHIRYIDLAGGQKPHLLVCERNNLGTETYIQYASSTKFYLQDNDKGRPWPTRLPFPVHVVERTEIVDFVGMNRFVSRFAYHDGYFDGPEREFRGFGMVEQLDTEEFEVLSVSGRLSKIQNLSSSTHTPPVLTKTWYHTGAFLTDQKLSRFHEKEYFREPGLSDEEYRGLLLPDTILPSSVRTERAAIPHVLSLQEMQEASRALKGAQLRQETYGLDQSEAASVPYNVTEANWTIDLFQPQGPNPNACLFTHSRESIQYHYERQLYRINKKTVADPRIQHALALATDLFGNELESVSIAYGRRYEDTSELLQVADHKIQRKTEIMYGSNMYTNHISHETAHRIPFLAETKSYQVLNFPDSSRLDQCTRLFRSQEIQKILDDTADGKCDVPSYDFEGRQASPRQSARRLIKHKRALFRRNDFSGPLPLGSVESLAIPFKSFHKVITAEHAERTFVAPDRFRSLTDLESAMHNLGYVNMEGDDWWIPSGTTFYSSNPDDAPEQELEFARNHYFLPFRVRDPLFSSTNKSETFVSYDKYDLLVVESKDALGNTVTVGERLTDEQGCPTVQSGNNYRLLTPVFATDANGNRAAVVHDVLGYVAGSAIMGKRGENKGDSLEGFEANLPDSVIADHFENPLRSSSQLLGLATTRFIYDIDRFQKCERKESPTALSTILRTTHVSDLKPDEASETMLNMAYFDGASQTIQTKIYAGEGSVDPEDSRSDAQAESRFICSGWTVFNNKGSPVQKFEPFYTSKHTFEFDKRVGVSSIILYDPLQRMVATLFPDRTFSKTNFDGWKEEKWDANDTILLNPLRDPDFGKYFRRILGDSFETWYETRLRHATSKEERQVAVKTAAHAGTPTVSFVDGLGRHFLTVHSLSSATSPGGTDITYLHDTSVLDIQGFRRIILDALGRVVLKCDYDMAGRKIHQSSMETGELWTLEHVEKGNGFGWDSKRQQFRTEYDVLHRPLQVYLSVGGQEEIMMEKTVYGEALQNPEIINARQQPMILYDQSGQTTTEAFDFKGNLLQGQRRLAREYKAAIDWAKDVELEPEIYPTSNVYDAANRKLEVTTPDGSLMRYRYNVTGNVLSVSAAFRGSPDEEMLVKRIDYNARNQRTLIQYGNGTTTVNKYDEATFRLNRIVTTRTCRPKASNEEKGAQRVELVQDLTYTYDPIGNVSSTKDDVQSSLFFRNKCVDPHSNYVYDSLYRLVQASGREHLGQAKDAFGNRFYTGNEHGNDGNAMARYQEDYTYDPAGNMLEIRHTSADSTERCWTKKFSFDETSQIESNRVNNRLSKVLVGGRSEDFSYDVAGNTTSMSTLPIMEWNHKGELSATSRQTVQSGAVPETTYYRYDARGGRIRKRTDRYTEPGRERTPLHERIYIGAFERYRKFSPSGEIVLERQSLRVGDSSTAFVIVEKRTIGTDKGTDYQLRYQYSNQLGAITLELSGDPTASLLSYEEYSPYGGTSYSACSAQLESTKRYRFSSKELDAETALYYYGKRYYNPYAVRWISPDPGGFDDTPNLYTFCGCNPVSKSDPSGGESDWLNRVTGALTVVGGALEIAVGVVGIAAPTGVTQVLGVVAVAHGADTTWAGLKQVWTGEQQKTWTEEKATDIAKAAGASDATAEKIGMGVDIGVGIVAEVGIAVAKVGVKATLGAIRNHADDAIQAVKTGVAMVGDAASSGVQAAKKKVGKAIQSAGEFMDDIAEGTGRMLGSIAPQPAFEFAVASAGRAAKAAPRSNALDNLLTMMSNISGESVEAAARSGAQKALDIAEKQVVWTKLLAGKSLKWFENVFSHHLFPQEFRAEFAQIFGKVGKPNDIIDLFTIPLDGIRHGLVHGWWGKITGRTNKWNADWAKFFADNAGKNITRRQLWEQLKKMMKEHGIEDYWAKWAPHRSHTK